VLIAHDFAETYGGAERIAATLASAFPDAPFWTILGRRSVAERMGVGDRFHTLLPERPRLLRHYRSLAPAYPLLVRSRPLPKADLLLTSSYAFAHGFRTRNRAPQVCYCYSPLRFAWSMTEGYGERWAPGATGERAFGAFAAAMRAADRAAARRVDRYVAESHYVAGQLRQAYGCDPDVVHPPVDCDRFRPAPDEAHEDYFLFCARLIEPYKRPGLVIDAFRDLDRRLLVAGDGPAYGELKRRAGDNVEFLGRLDDDDLVPVMQRAAATVFPSVDDFGLIPVETMACGRPVLAFAGGGALETVVAGRTGEFFDRPTVECLRDAVERFDPEAYDPAAIRAHAEHWKVDRFLDEMTRIAAQVAGSHELRQV
jgi:glycosyltransferase involved in cell wall biosynthesis